MQIRFFSDLHIEVNHYHNFAVNNPDQFTLVAGDISGYAPEAKKWLEKNVHNGIFVAGNHIVYNTTEKTILHHKKQLANWFPVSNNLTFLDESVNQVRKDLDEKTMVIGSTLYCDGLLYKAKFDSVFNAADYAWRCMEQGMNDFYWGWTEDENGNPRHLRAKDYATLFGKTIDSFGKILEENEMSDNPKDVIILTHFCPSPKFIVKKYEDSPLNPGFVSNLDWFIEQHKSIKAWICGHVHSRINTTFKREDGSECLLACNPMGYLREAESMGWTPEMYLDTETWKIFRKDS